MSDEKGSVQLSALINRLLAHPQLMETIASLLREAGNDASDDTKTQDETSSAMTEVAQTQEEESEPTLSEIEAEPKPEPPTVPTVAKIGQRGERRHRLLCAIKPYLSEPRAKALDSIEAIAELMDVLKHA